MCGNDYGLGGAVHIEENNVSLGGSVKIKDNHYITKTGEFAAGDLVVDGTNSNNYCFSITSALTDEADIGLYAWYEGKVGESLTGHTITKSDLAKFTLQNPKYDLRLTDDNSIELCKPHTVHTWSEDWSVDDMYHWHECTYPDCSLADNSQKNGYEEHKWNSGIITIPATEENEGVRTFTCTICGKTKTESIPKLPSGDVSKPDVSSVPEHPTSHHSRKRPTFQTFPKYPMNLLNPKSRLIPIFQVCLRSRKFPNPTNIPKRQTVLPILRKVLQIPKPVDHILFLWRLS